jgi:hypothetical protein
MSLFAAVGVPANSPAPDPYLSYSCLRAELYSTPIKSVLTACFSLLARCLILPQRGSRSVEKLQPQGYIAL